MAITFDSAVISGNSGSNVTSHTVSHTVSSGTALLLIGIFRSSGSANDPLVDTVTYAGAEAPVLREENNGGSSQSRTLTACHQTPPAAEGANNIAVAYTVSATRSSISSQNFFGTGLSVRASNGNTFSGSIPNSSVASELGDLAVDLACCPNTTSDSNSPDRIDAVKQFDVQANQLTRCSARRPGVASTTAMSWTLTSSGPWAFIVVSLMEEVGGGTVYDDDVALDAAGAVDLAAARILNNTVAMDAAADTDLQQHAILLASLGLDALGTLAQAGELAAGAIDEEVALTAESDMQLAALAVFASALSLSTLASTSQAGPRMTGGNAALDAQAGMTPAAVADLLNAVAISGLAALSPTGKLIAEVARTLSSGAELTAAGLDSSAIDEILSFSAAAGIDPAASTVLFRESHFGAAAQWTAAGRAELAAVMQLQAQADVHVISTQVANLLMTLGVDAAQAQSAAQSMSGSLALAVDAMIAMIPEALAPLVDVELTETLRFRIVLSESRPTHLTLAERVITDLELMEAIRTT